MAMRASAASSIPAFRVFFVLGAMLLGCRPPGDSVMGLGERASLSCGCGSIRLILDWCQRQFRASVIRVRSALDLMEDWFFVSRILIW